MSYNISGVTSADVSSPLTGSVTLDANGKAYVDVVTVADKTTEGAETIKFALSGGESASTALTDSSTAASATPKSFVLTTGIDTGANFVGAATDDSYAATGDALTAGDTLDGGAGTDTLTITDVAGSLATGVPAGVVLNSIENVVITSTGKVGTAASLNTGQTISFTFTDSPATTTAPKTATYNLVPNGTTTAVTANADTGLNASSDANGALSAGYAVTALSALYRAAGYSVTNTGAAPTAANVVDIKADTPTTGSGDLTTTVKVLGAPGVSLPVPYVTAVGADALSPIIVNTAATVAASANAWALPTNAAGTNDETSLKVSATGGANISSSATTDTTVTNTSGQTTVSGGLSQTITAGSSSVYASGSKGAVAITQSSASLTGGFYVATTSSTSGSGLNGAWGTDTAYQKGVLVTGGTTVSVTGAAATVSSNALTAGNSNAIQIGSGGVGTNNIKSTGSATGTETIRNLALDPTGNVTTKVATAYTNTTGQSSVAYGGGSVNITMNGGTTASVTGAAGVTILDVGTVPLVPSTGATAVAGTSKLTTVNLTGISGTANITSDAITTVSVSDTLTVQGVNVQNSGTTGANSGAISYVLSNVGNVAANGSVSRVTLTDATAATVNVSSGSASAYAMVGTTTGAAVASNTGSASYVTVSAAKATTINLTNSLAVDLGDFLANAAKVATVNGASATGAISLTVGSTPLQGLKLTTGSGNDVVSIASGANLAPNATSAAATTIDLGAGNDTLLNLGTSAPTMTGVTVNGGAGTDTVAASLVTAGNGTQFVGFETLGLDLTSGAYDTDLLVGATGLALISGGATYTNVEQAQGLTVTKGVTGTTTLTFTAANVSGASDSYAVTFNAAGASAYASATAADAGVLVIEGIEKVTVNSGSSAGYTANAINLSDAAATSLTLTGSQDLKVHFGALDTDDTAVSPNTTGIYFGTTGTSTDTNGVALIDGSALTGKLTIDTTDVGVAYAGLTVKGGSANDTITLVTDATVYGNAGDDSITVSDKGATVYGGAGKDTVDVHLALVGSGATVLTTIADAASGDSIQFKDVTGTTALGFTKADVASATTLAGALDIAAGSATAAFKWFNYGGNTYIVQDLGSSTTALTSADVVVKLTGTLDLSTSTLSGAELLTFA